MSKPRPRSAPAMPKRRPGPGFAQQFTPSSALAAIIGTEPITRAQATARTWVYIREHELQDPADRRTIVADDALRPILGADRIGMFKLAGQLGAHLVPVTDAA